MRNFKKRIVSFVSAIAMAVTMLPSASLFASAAQCDVSIESSDTDTTGYRIIKDFATDIADFQAGREYQLSLEGLNLSQYTDVKLVADVVNGKEIKFNFGEGDPKVGDTRTGAIAFLFTDFEMNKTSFKFSCSQGDGKKYGSLINARVDSLVLYGKGGPSTGTIKEVIAAKTDFTGINWKGNCTLNFALNGYDSAQLVVAGVTNDVQGGIVNDTLFRVSNTLHTHDFTSTEMQSYNETTTLKINGDNYDDGIGGSTSPLTSVRVIGTKSNGTDPDPSEPDNSEPDNSESQTDPTPTKYTVNFSGENGTVTAATAGGNPISSGDSVAEGTEVTFTAAPNSGYEFAEWNDGNTTNPRTVTVKANTTLTATFREEVVEPVGDVQEVFAIVDNAFNSKLSDVGSDNPINNNNWRVDQDFLNNAVNHSQKQNARIALPFVVDDISADVNYEVKIYAVGKQSIKAYVWNSSNSVVKQGDNTFDVQNELTDWDKLKTDPQVFNIKGNEFASRGTYYAGVQVDANNNQNYINFYKIVVTKSGGSEPEPTTYTVTATAGEGGTAEVDKTTATKGGTATFTAKPNSGYEFDKWSDGSTENPHTITINADTTLIATFRAVSTSSVTWPQEVFAVADNGTSTENLNSALVYFGGVTSGDFRVDTSKELPFLNNNGNSVSSGSKVALPFVIDDTSAEVTYTIKLYAKAKENAYACLWRKDGDTYVEDLYEENTNPVLHPDDGSEPNWNGVFNEPATFEMTGDEFIHGTGTYYAGVSVYGSNSDNWINLWKVEVTKTGGTDEYAEVLPHKNAGNITKSGNILTASPKSARYWKFVGWYRDEACTELDRITTNASTEVSEGNKLYAKFDYVKYDMPIIDITTSTNSESFNAAWKGEPKDKKYSKSKITIANTDWKLPTVTTDEGTRPMQVEIKGRGNSTWVLDKKPFQIKFEEPVQPFNMGSEPNKTWILLANHADRTLMRNQLAYDWARTALSNLPFVTDTEPVELYINGEYQGVYLLVEKSEVGSKDGRVNIEMAETNTSEIDEIGFLAEWDKLAANKDSKGNPAEDYVVRVSGGGWSELFTIKDGIPECKTKGADGRPSDATTFDKLGDQSTEVTNTNSTVNAIDEYLSDIAVAIMSGKESDIKTKVDINSLVDMFILQELTKNPDAGGSSFYVYKDKGAGAKLIFSPPWDFDKALGDEVRVTSPYGLYIYGGDDQNDNNVNTWYRKLYEQDWFKTLVRNRWKELRKDPAKDPKTFILSFIEKFPTTYSDEIDRNRNKWYTDATTEYQYSEGGFWGDKGLSGYFADEGKTYDAQKNGLYKWVTDRITFLDAEWDDSEWVLIEKYPNNGFELTGDNDHVLNFNVKDLFEKYSRVKIVVDGKGYDLRMYLDPPDPNTDVGKLAIPHQTLGNPQTSGNEGFEKISYELHPEDDASKNKAILQAQKEWSWVREFAIYGVEIVNIGEELTNQPTFRVNNASYGSLSKQVSDEVYYHINERITAVAKEGYKFVNWTIVTDNGKNVVPITDVISGVSETSSRLTITEAMAGRIIYANFGKLQEIKFEAEDFVNFISEGYIVSKGRTGKITEDGKTYTAEVLAAANDGNGQKISNDAFFGRNWTHDVLGYGSASMPYDKPKVVADNGGNETQIWDNSLYTDHNIVTEGYSGGEAVALTGPTSGIAIPFSIAEQLYEPFKFAVGYNYGDLPTYFWDFNQKNGWNLDSLYVNIYTTAELTAEQRAALEANGWSLSGYATPDAASDYLLNNAEANDGELQTAFYKRLPINAANTNGWTGRWITNNSEEARENVQEVDISIPAGMPAGQYYISVATDHNNLKRDSARMRLQENGGLVIKEGGNNASGYYDEGNTSNTDIYSEGDHTEKPGTAYYDYIKFYTASTPDKPSQITVGANFIFKDMFGNSLMTNEFTDASFDEGLVTFTPKVPRYLKVQGYKIDYWEYTDPNGNPAKLYVTDVNDGSLGDHEDVNNDGTWNNNNAFELLAQRLETLHYKQGTTVTFTAHYTVPDRQYEVTLNNGTMFTCDESMGEFDDPVEPHETYLVGNYQKIKLVADESSRLGEFSHWELNGQIYSYDREIFFTAWTNAKFEACYVEKAPQPKAATFIDTENIQMYGFTDDTTTAYNKITFNCAFYIPDGVEYVGGGLLYTPDEAKLQDRTIETLVTINELGELQLPADGRIAVSVLRYEQLDHDLNNQVLMSITGTKKGKMRTARTYIIYKQIIDGVPKYTLAFSQDYVTVEAGDEKYMSTI